MAPIMRRNPPPWLRPHTFQPGQPASQWPSLPTASRASSMTRSMVTHTAFFRLDLLVNAPTPRRLPVASPADATSDVKRLGRSGACRSGALERPSPSISSVSFPFLSSSITLLVVLLLLVKCLPSFFCPLRFFHVIVNRVVGAQTDPPSLSVFPFIYSWTSFFFPPLFGSADCTRYYFLPDRVLSSFIFKSSLILLLSR